jgi:hypothetical protein
MPSVHRPTTARPGVQKSKELNPFLEIREKDRVSEDRNRAPLTRTYSATAAASAVDHEWSEQKPAATEPFSQFGIDAAVSREKSPPMSGNNTTLTGIVATRF